jgi:hypothetical protein
MATPTPLEARSNGIAPRPGGRSFVEVTSATAASSASAAPTMKERRDRSTLQAPLDAAEPAASPLPRPADPGWNLWGDLES